MEIVKVILVGVVFACLFFRIMWRFVPDWVV